MRYQFDPTVSTDALLKCRRCLGIFFVVVVVENFSFTNEEDANLPKAYTTGMETIG